MHESKSLTRSLNNSDLLSSVRKKILQVSVFVGMSAFFAVEVTEQVTPSAYAKSETRRQFFNQFAGGRDSKISYVNRKTGKQTLALNLNQPNMFGQIEIDNAAANSILDVALHGDGNFGNAQLSSKGTAGKVVFDLTNITGNTLVLRDAQLGAGTRLNLTSYKKQTNGTVTPLHHDLIIYVTQKEFSHSQPNPKVGFLGGNVLRGDKDASLIFKRGD